MGPLFEFLKKKVHAEVYFDLKGKCFVTKNHEWLCYLYTVFVLLRYLNNVTVNATFQAFERTQLRTHAGAWRCVTQCLFRDRVVILSAKVTCPIKTSDLFQMRPL